MTGIVEKVNTPATQDAYVYAVVETASIKLLLGKGEEVRKDLDAGNKILDTFDSIDNVIHAAFYRVNADYYSVHLPQPLVLQESNQVEQNRLCKLLSQRSPFPRLSS
jgi:hypothetical protein